MSAASWRLLSQRVPVQPISVRGVVWSFMLRSFSSFKSSSHGGGGGVSFRRRVRRSIPLVEIPSPSSSSPPHLLESVDNPDEPGDGARLARSHGASSASSSSAPIPGVAPPTPAIVALLGKPNVGKSMLFNRLVGVNSPAAVIVRNTPTSHTTRDIRYGHADIGDITFAAVDTAGLEPWAPSGHMLARTREICKDMLASCDAVVFMLDARAGVSGEDAEAASWVRRNVKINTPIIPVMNKCENNNFGEIPEHVTDAVAESHALGLGDPVAISAATGEGMIDLATELLKNVPALLKSDDDDDGDEEAQMEMVIARAGGRRRRKKSKVDDNEERNSEQEGASAQERISVAIVGIPNVGKSTLMNRLMKQQRSLTGPEAGLTRDVVVGKIVDEETGIELHLADTAGWIKDSLERRGWLSKERNAEQTTMKIAAMSARQAKGAFHMASVVIVVVDARSAKVKKGYGQGHHRTAQQVMSHTLSDVEASIIRLAEKEGRAVVIALNKADGLKKRAVEEAQGGIQKLITTEASGLSGAPVVPISAATGQNVRAVLDAAAEQYRKWNTRVGTGELNDWLYRLQVRNSGYGGGSGVGRIRYITQVGIRPPSFVAFLKGQAAMEAPQLRFIRNSIRDAFMFNGVPIRVVARLGRKYRG